MLLLLLSNLRMLVDDRSTVGSLLQLGDLGIEVFSSPDVVVVVG